MNIFGRRGERPAVIDDQTRQPQTGARGQGSVSVGHEGLLVREAVPRQLHFTTGGLHLSADHRRVTKQRPWTSHLEPVRSWPRPSARASPARRPESTASRAFSMPAASDVAHGRAGRVVDRERRTGVEQYGVAHRRPARRPAAGVRRRRCARRRRRAGPRRCRGRARVRPGRRVASATSPSCTRHTVEVVVVVSSSSPSSPRNTQASTPRPAKHAGHHRRHPRVGAADRLGGRPGRVGQRAEEVEGGADAELAPRHGGVPHRRVEGGGEAEGDAGLVGHARRPGPAGRSSRMPSASSTSARAGLRGRRAVAVLDHAGAGAGGDDRGHRGDVDRHRPVAAGADDVEQPAGHRDRGRRAAYIAVDQARRPRRWSRPWRAARPRSRRSATGVASPARISPIAQAVCSAVEVAAGDQRGEDLGPGRAAWSVMGRSPAVRRWRGRASAAARRRPRRAGSGRSGAARRPRRATRSPARRPAAGRSAPATGGHW